MTGLRLFRVLALVGMAVGAGQSATRAQAGIEWRLPAGFPAPVIPADSPMTPELVELGRHLFYDTRLSGNGRQSCASCHQQSKAFTDGLARSVGSTGQVHPRGSMSLVNVAYASILNWGSPDVTRLEDQALVPMYGEHPVELGLDRADTWLRAIEADRTHQRLFRAAFPSAAGPFTAANVTRALAAFQRSIVSARSPYDRYHFDREDNAVSESAKRGEVLFNSGSLACFTCHRGIHFSSAMGSNRGRPTIGVFNTGLYNLPGQFSYPEVNAGVYTVTRDPKDVGRFKAPTLRNIAVTAPYMHDGSVATLDAMIDHYAAGGRTITSGPYKGVGRDNPLKHPAVRGFSITPAERADLIAFLESLTDHALLTDRRFSDPWPAVGAPSTPQPRTLPAGAPAPVSQIDNVLVFAAASLQTALDELAGPIQLATGVRIRVSYAASSALARQIESGAPAEVFISADLEWMTYLADRKLVRRESQVNLLGNRLVLIASRTAPVAMKIAPGFALSSALGRNRLALADPASVPAGKYAKAALTSLGVWDSVSGKIAAAENVRAALLLVSRGEAPLGIVYHTDAAVDRGVVIVDTFPENTHAPITYPAALTSEATPAAASVLGFLKTGTARAIFEKHGFSRPK